MQPSQGPEWTGLVKQDILSASGPFSRFKEVFCTVPSAILQISEGLFRGRRRKNVDVCFFYFLSIYYVIEYVGQVIVGIRFNIQNVKIIYLRPL